MGKSKRQRYLDRKKEIARRRRKHWQTECQYCTLRWHNAKSNFLVVKSGTCQGCLSYLAQVIKRGAAWIAQRRITLGIWDTRLESTQQSGKKTKLRSIRGGRR